jgi:HNH endonuclease
MSRWEPLTVEERFWNHVEVTESCWLWTGALNQYGYGNFVVKASRPTKNIGAHRFSHLIFKGPIPKGKEIDHLCKVRRCIHPQHIESVTHRENLMRGETLGALNARKTHCYKGHSLSGDNLLIKYNGFRSCRVCQKKKNRRAYLKRREAQIASV